MNPFKTGKQCRSYAVERDVTEEEVLTLALKIVARKYRRGRAITSPEATREYFSLKLAYFEHEVFCVLFLDNGNRVLKFDPMFRGTINSASVYPREVVKAALECNAAAVILAHNHPSGLAEPSQADRAITERLKQALDLVDVRVLDHFVLAGNSYVSFAERGML